MIAAGGLSGGFSSAIAGGNFWQGVKQGIITSGLNHATNHVVEELKDDDQNNGIDKKFLKKLAKHINDKILPNLKEQKSIGPFTYSAADLESYFISLTEAGLQSLYENYSFLANVPEASESFYNDYLKGNEVSIGEFVTEQVLSKFLSLGKIGSATLGAILSNGELSNGQGQLNQAIQNHRQQMFNTYNKTVPLFLNDRNNASVIYSSMRTNTLPKIYNR